tara:strand:- start:980 stop:1723 length:744 start_codon:yes stop_codon:yes gene_type:complete
MFQVFSPSYKRAEIAKTHKYLPFITYVVMESEAEEYKKIHDKIWVIPDKVQGNLARVWNYILDNAKEKNVITVDDDIKNFGRWNGNKKQKLNEGQVLDMILEGIQLAEDLDIRYWGLNCLADKGAYREYTPFGTISYIGGPFQAHRNNDLRYDEKIFLKEDYDMTLQVLNKYRKNLRLNMYHYECEQATIKGGCADYRNVEIEKRQNLLLQNKWGSKIVTQDNSQKKNSNKRSYDFNPILKIPIRGI